MKSLLLKTGAFILAFNFALNLNAQDAWTNSAVNGIDHSYNSTVYGMEVFNGFLYAAAGNDSGYVYRTASGNPGTWSKVFSNPNSESVEAIKVSPIGGGNMYIASKHPFFDTSRVFRSTDGINWSTFYFSSAHVTHIQTFKGTGTQDSVYMTDNTPGGGIIVKSAFNSNDPLNLGGAWDTVLRFDTAAFGAQVAAFEQFGSKLYAGTDGGQVFSTSNGINWTANANIGFGFGIGSNKSISAIGSFGGYIYVGTDNNGIGAQLWRSNDEVNWTMVQQFSSSYKKVSSLKVADGKLWVTVFNPFGAGLVLYTSNGTTLVGSNTNGFGSQDNNGNVASIIQFGNNVYWTGENNGGGGGRALQFGGAEIWRKCTVAPPAISLGADQMVCAGATVVLNAGAGMASYLWNDNSTSQTNSVTAPGVFTVQCIGSNGCSAADTIAINATPPPTVNITSPSVGVVTVCCGTTTNIYADAVSNVYVPVAPIHRMPHDTIDDTLPPQMDTVNIGGLTGTCACTSLYSVTIDSLTHTFAGDVNLGLYSPSGAFITLSSSNGGGSGAGYFGTEFRMDALSPISGGAAPFTGQFIPQDDFNMLYGTPNGDWVLRVSDNAGGDNGVLRGYTIRFKNADTMMTFSWTPSTGLTSVNTLNTVATVASSTTYTLTTTNSLGCVATSTIQFDVPDLAFAQAVDTACFGGNITLTAIGGTANTTWFPTAELNASTGPSVLATPTASTVYYVTDTIAGCPLLDSIHVHANAQLFLNPPASQTICSGDTAVLGADANGGSAPYLFAWDTGGGNYIYGDTIYQALTTGASYTLSVTDAAGCQLGGGGTSVLVTPSTDVHGHVTYTGGTVNLSSVVLYRYEPFLTHFDTVQTTTTDANGDYFFSSVNHHEYLIEVFPAASYTTLVPTYYGNVFLWDAATRADHGCAITDTFNIAMTEETPFIGPGSLEGYIREDTGYVRQPGDPIPGVDVKLGRNPGGQLVTSTNTGTDGSYRFANLAYGDYVIYADVPGLGRDSSYTVTLDATNDSIVDLDYLVNDTIVFIQDQDMTTGIAHHGGGTSMATTFRVYPNPSNGIANIDYSLASEANVSLGIYNVLGVKVLDIVHDKQMPGTYRCGVNTQKDKELSSGVYFVALIIDGKTEIHRLVINK